MEQEEKRNFLGEFYPFEVKKERFKIVECLVRDVLHGIQDQYFVRGKHVAHDKFRKSVKAAAFRFFEMQEPKMSKSFKINTGDTHDLVISAFEESLRFSGSRKMFTPAFEDKELVAKFSEKFGTVPRPWVGQYSPSIQGAYDAALDNFKAVQTRSVSLNVVSKLLRPSDYLSAELEGLDEIKSTLDQRNNQNMIQLMVIGGLIGGEAAREATKLVANETVFDPNASTNYALMHLIQMDRMLPGRWMSADEQELRDSIVEAYDKL